MGDFNRLFEDVQDEEGCPDIQKRVDMQDAAKIDHGRQSCDGDDLGDEIVALVIHRPAARLDQQGKREDEGAEPRHARAEHVKLGKATRHESMFHPQGAAYEETSSPCPAHSGLVVEADHICHGRDENAEPEKRHQGGNRQEPRHGFAVVEGGDARNDHDDECVDRVVALLFAQLGGKREQSSEKEAASNDHPRGCVAEGNE